MEISQLSQAIGEGFFTELEAATIRRLFGNNETLWANKLRDHLGEMLVKEILPKISGMISAAYKLLVFAKRNRENSQLLVIQ